MEIDLSKLEAKEIKAHIYDAMLLIEQSKANIQTLQSELQRRNNELKN